MSNRDADEHRRLALASKVSAPEMSLLLCLPVLRNAALCVCAAGAEFVGSL